MTLRIGLWCAVSSRAQAQPDKFSLADQEAAGRRFAESLSAAVASVYRVPGHSRDFVFWHEAEAEMPAYRAVREDLEAHRLDVIHAIDADRLGRDAALISQFVSLAERHHCEVYLASMPHPIGQQSVGHRYLHAIAGVRADEDNALRTRRMVAGMRSRVTKRGLFASNPPLGYSPVLNAAGHVTGYELNQDAAIVRQMTAWFLAGLPYEEIWRRTNATGISHPNRPGQPWHYGTIRLLLQNDAYAGLAHWGVVQAGDPSPHIEPLWDGATFAAIVRERQRRYSGGYIRHGAGPLTGIAYCARCDKPMTRILSRGRWNMRCATHAHYWQTGPRPCHANTTREDFILSYLGKWLGSHLSPEDFEAEAYQRWSVAATDQLAADLAAARRAVQECAAQRERLAHALASGQMDAAIYRTTDDSILSRIVLEEQRAAELERHVQAVPAWAERIQALWTLVQDFEQFIAEMEPAAVSARLQLAGLRVCVEDRRPVRVSLV